MVLRLMFEMGFCKEKQATYVHVYAQDPGEKKME